MKSRNTSLVLILFLPFSFYSAGWCGKIIYPWRATTAIVKSGENFEVWFDADDGQIIDSVELEGPYNSVSTSFSVENGNWIYDKWSGNTYNRKINVQVPEDTPADRYNLILKIATGDEISIAAVKVIKEYKSSYYVMHFSDPHRWEASKDTPGIIYPEQSTVIDIANIIAPEMFIETGDCYWQSSNSSTNIARLDEFINGTGIINGLNDLNTAYFAIPGNHDTPTHNYYNEPDLATPARAWNEYFGLTCQNFTYGNTRFVGITNSWCPSTGGGDPGYVANYQWQLDAATSWIDSVGKGNLRIGFFHVPQESVPPLYNAFKNAGAPFGLLLGGHIHRYTTNPYSIDGKPIIYTAAGVQNGINGAPFNLYKIDNIKGTFETVGNSYSGHAGLETDMNYNTCKLKLSYSDENNGTKAYNRATIVNKFNFPIESARVRFILPKGKEYINRNGIIMQAFDGDAVHVFDVSIDLKANSTTTVEITSVEKLEHNLLAFKQTSKFENIPAFTTNHSPELIVWNIGENEELNVPISCEIRSEGEIVYSNIKTIDKIGTFEMETVTFDNWNASSSAKYDIAFTTNLSNDQDKSSDSLRSSFNVTNLLDDFETDFEKWTTHAGWGRDSRIVNNGEFCLAVNPGLRYENNMDSYAEYTYSFNLTSVINPQITFWSRKSIMEGDTGFVEISVDGGVSWKRIGEGFSGLTITWEQINISLSDYGGSADLRLRFRFISDEENTHLGWFIDDIKIEHGITGIDKTETGEIPSKYELYDNYPNPFNPLTTIGYSMPHSEFVQLKIYDVLGKEVATLVNEYKVSGYHKIEFNASDLNSGVYFYRLQCSGFNETKKLILLR